MNLDDRLSAARDEYRSLAVPGADAAPAEVPRAPDPGDPAHPERRRGRTALVAAAAVIALVVAVIVVRPDGADDDEVTVTSPEVQPSEDIEKSNNPPGAVAVYDEQIVLTPEGPYDDGAEVTITVPSGYALDLANGGARVCVTLADAPDGPGEWCDPMVLSRYEGGSNDSRVIISVRRDVFTPTGWRDCNDSAVVCRVVIEAADASSRASAPMAFTGSPRGLAVSLEAVATEPQGGFELFPTGLAADESWLAYAETFPKAALERGAFWLTLCAFDVSDHLDGPFGEPFWDTSGESSLPHANCDSYDEPAVIDPRDPNVDVEVVQPQWIHGYGGWSNCHVDVCFLMVQTFRGIAIDGSGATWSTLEPTVASLLPSGWVSHIDNRPRLAVLTPGPHVAGQTIEIEITGMGSREPTNLGVCHIDNPWGCGYLGASFGQMSDGRHEVTLPDQMPTGTSFVGANSCPPETCYLELDSQGEGLPPLAVAPLDTNGSG